MKAAEFGVELDDRAAGELSERLKALESEGFVFEAADASLELLMRQATGWSQRAVRASRRYRVSAYHREGTTSSVDGRRSTCRTEATVKIWVGDERIASVGEGNGPVNALDAALRAALVSALPGAWTAST